MVYCNNNNNMHTTRCLTAMYNNNVVGRRIVLRVAGKIALLSARGERGAR